MKRLRTILVWALFWVALGPVSAADLEVPPGLKAPPAAQGVITAIHQDGKIVVQDILFNVDEHTRITGRYQQRFGFEENKSFF